MPQPECLVDQVAVSAYSVPTDAPEADGTFAWQRTVLVTVRASSAGVTGLGYTYADAATATLIETLLAKVVLGRNAFALTASYDAMVRAVRNLGSSGIAAMAISAVDAALWDLKARLLDVAVATLLGPVRETVAIYGSGGFTSYGVAELQERLAAWVARGIPRVKMKVGSEPTADIERVTRAREAIGRATELFVDANGAYTRKQALSRAEAFAELGVSWFEEPVSSDDHCGLALLVQRAPAMMEITAGEYGYHPEYFERMIGAGAVDVVQADATRCGGVTGFMKVAAICDARGMPLSAHCAPALHVQLGCAASRLRHLEYFHDHVRIESMLFDGVPQPASGEVTFDRACRGFGLELRERDAQRYLLGSSRQRRE